MAPSMRPGLHTNRQTADADWKGWPDPSLATGSGIGGAVVSEVQPASVADGGRQHDHVAELDRSERTSGAALIEALIVTLTLAEQESSTPPALGGKLAELVARAEAALLSVREIAHGIYPSALAAFGLLTALRAQARRAPVDVNVDGIASRSTEDAEIGVYFSCLEAIQNVAKHAGRGARVTLQCQHHDGRLVVRIADDGDGFDPASTPDRRGPQQHPRSRPQPRRDTRADLTSGSGHRAGAFRAMAAAAAERGRRHCRGRHRRDVPAPLTWKTLRVCSTDMTSKIRRLSFSQGPTRQQPRRTRTSRATP